MSEVYSSTTTRKYPSIVYHGGLRTRNISYIVVHHNAGVNTEAALQTWTVGSGAWTSAHYQVTPNETIGVLGENYVAYHAGGTGPNDRPKINDINNLSIGIEHVNSTGAPDWKVDDKTLRRSAALIADICKRYGLPINKSTIKGHNEITKTACPGGIDVNKLIRYAQEAAGEKKTYTTGQVVTLKDWARLYDANDKLILPDEKKDNVVFAKGTRVTLKKRINANLWEVDYYGMSFRTGGIHLRQGNFQ